MLEEHTTAYMSEHIESVPWCNLVCFKSVVPIDGIIMLRLGTLT